MIHLCVLALTSILAFDGLAAAAGMSKAAEEVTPLEVVAAAVRVRGHACESPESATRDEEASRPDRAAWTITCESGRYQVIFEGDTGARVEPLP